MKFSELLNVSTKKFFADYWEEELVFSQFQKSFGFLNKPLEDWPQKTLIHIINYGDFIMVKDNKLVRKPFFMKNNNVDLDRVFFLWDNGYTFYARNLSNVMSSIKAITDQLEEELYPLKIEVNIFVSPEKSTGFFPHFDCHDVIVLQLAGSKKWSFWNAIKQDMDYESPTAEDQTQVNQYIHSNSPNLVKTIKRGDSFYMPRGTIHAPKSIEHSSHMTFWLKSPLIEKLENKKSTGFEYEEYKNHYF